MLTPSRGPTFLVVLFLTHRRLNIYIYIYKFFFFHSPIEPIIDGGSTSWSRTGANIITPVESLHTRALRVILLRYTTLMDSEAVNTRPVFRINKGWLLTDGF